MSSTFRGVQRSRAHIIESLFDSHVRHQKLWHIEHILEPAALKLLSHLGQLKEGERVIDVGCGIGAVVRRASRVVGETGKAVGIDVSGEMIRLCREKDGEGEYHQLDIAPVSAQNRKDFSPEPGDGGVRAELHPEETLEWGTYDWVTSFQTMHFMADPYFGARQHVRLLKSGGRLIMGLSFFTENATALPILESVMKQTDRGDDPGASLHSIATWVSILSSTGLHVDPPAIFTLADADQYLVLTGTLKPVRAIPSPSDTLLF
eukprot:gene6666-10220_t